MDDLNSNSPENDQFSLNDPNSANRDDEIMPLADLSNLSNDTVTLIARSAFADMLWDKERNLLYYKAVKKVLTRLLTDKLLSNQLNNKFTMLDIGAGTGLLSMFTYKVLNEFLKNHPEINKINKKIVALERFFYSYLTGKDIVFLNNMNDKIRFIFKDSLSESDLKIAKIDFLVSELFDTELIGEAALTILRDAKKKFLKQDASMVPRRAHMYCQLIESKFLTSGHLFRSIRIRDGERTICIDQRDEINSCPGSFTQLNDLQLNSLNINDFKLVSDVKVAFEFDFKNVPNNKFDSARISFKILNMPKKFSNVCVALWWDLDMDDEGEIVLSCAPYWARNDVYYEKVFAEQLIDDVSTLFKWEEQSIVPRNVDEELENLRNGCFAKYSKFLSESKGKFSSIIEQNFEKLRLSCQWRDHWMQAVYFLPKDALKNRIIEQDILEIQAFRNDYQFWFGYHSQTQSQNIVEQTIKAPACSCGYHRVYSRNEIRQINDYQSNNLMAASLTDLYREFMEKTLDGSSLVDSKGLKKIPTCNVMFYGGMGIIPLVFLKLIPDSKIFIYNAAHSCPFYKEIIFEEKLEDKFPTNTNSLNKNYKIDILVKDPCINLDMLPWLDTHHFLRAYRCLLSQKVLLVYPNRISFKVMPVCFDHLWKIRFVIQKIDGLDLKPFRDMVDIALERESRNIEMYSLHEYDGIALAQPQLLTCVTAANMNSYKGETNLTFDFNCEEIRNRLAEMYGVNEEANGSIFVQELDRIVPFRRSLTNITFVIWPEYKNLANTGASTVKVDYSTRISWNKLNKQAVYFTPELHRDVLKEFKQLRIKFSLNYDFGCEENIFQLYHKNELLE